MALQLGWAVAVGFLAGSWLLGTVMNSVLGWCWLGVGFAGELVVSVSSGTVMVPEVALTDEGRVKQDAVTKSKTSSRVVIPVIFSPFFTGLISRIKEFLSTFLD